MKKAISELFGNIASQLPKTDKPETSSESFNIFSILGVETKEVIICRFLRELLDPSGTHQLQEKPLVLFVQNVLGYTDFDAAEAKDAKVITEELIHNKRRVDLVIRTRKRVIPIEVKVWAGDQDAQLSDYYHYYRISGQNCVFYLTPTGWTPSAQSRGKLTVGNEIKLLAFDRNIRPWLESLLQECSCESAKLCIKQFKEVINKMCAASAETKLIEDILGLDNEQFDPDNAALQAFIAIMNCSDDIAHKVRQSYIRQYVKLGDDFQFSSQLDTDDKKVDSHAVMRIEHKGKPVAWLCVDTNLYLVAKKLKSNESSWAHARDTIDYHWTYVGPENRNRLPLKNLKTLPQKEFSIEHLLNNIDLSGE